MWKHLWIVLESMENNKTSLKSKIKYPTIASTQKGFNSFLFIQIYLDGEINPFNFDWISFSLTATNFCLLCKVITYHKNSQSPVFIGCNIQYANHPISGHDIKWSECYVYNKFVLFTEIFSFMLRQEPHYCLKDKCTSCLSPKLTLGTYCRGLLRVLI